MIWYKTLIAVNDVSRFLQSEAIIIDGELLLVGKRLEDLKRIRGSRSQIFQVAVAGPGPLGFETELATNRKRFLDQASNTAHFHYKEKKEFEVNILNIGLDSLIQDGWRFFHSSGWIISFHSRKQSSRVCTILSERCERRGSH